MLLVTSGEFRRSMESRFHVYQEHQVHSIRFGTGPELLIAFHGFADRARIFAPLTEALGRHYMVVAFDLPFHGQTLWASNTFTQADMVGIVQMYMQEAEVERVSLLGYSFGARIVQALMPDLASKTDRLILLAPDGIATKGMRAAIYTPMWVRRLCFHIIRGSGWFMQIVTALKKMRLVSPMIWLFLDKNLSSPERYQRTFGMWFALDHFWLRRRLLNALINQYRVSVHIFFGKRDVFIKYQEVKKLAQKVPGIQLHLLDAGHRIIGPDLAARIEKVWSKPCAANTDIASETIKR